MAEQVGLQALFETDQFTAGLRKYLDGIDQANDAAVKQSSSITKAGDISAAGFGLVAGAAGAMAMKVVDAVGQVISKIALLPGEIIGVGISVESAFAGVLKTTDNLVDGFGNLTALGQQVRDGFRELALATPTDLEELMDVGALAGQLGIADDQIVGFTETMAALGVSTNLTAEAAASDIAKLQNIFKVAAGDMADNAARFGSVIVALGNNFATTEADIVNFSQRIAGAGKIAGLTEAQVAAIGAAMSSVGIEAEAGGTAVQKVLLSMHEAVLTGNKDFTVFADTVGLSADVFKDLWEKDAGRAFELFVEGLGRQGDKAIFTLQALGLEDQRLIRSFLSLSGAGDLLSRTLGTANQAWEENTALSIEAGRRYETTESKIKMMENALKDAGLTIADKLLPFINPLVEDVSALIQSIDTTAIQGFADAIGNFGLQLQNGAFAQDLLPAIAEGLDKVAADRQPDFSWLDTLATQINNASVGLATMLGAQTPEAFFTALTGGNEGLTDFFMGLIPVFDILSGAVTAFVDTMVNSVWPQLQAAFDSLTEAMAKAGISWDDVWSALGVGITVVVGIIAGVIAVIIGIVAGLVNAIAAGINSTIEIWSLLGGAIDEIVKGIIDILSGWIGFWKSIFEGNFPAALKFAEQSLNGFGELFIGVFDYIIIAVGGLVKIVYDILAGFVTGVTGFFTNLYNELVGHSIVPDIVDGIISVFTDLVSAGPKVFQDFVDAILKVAGSLAGGIMSLLGLGGDDAGGSATGGVETAFMALQTSFDTMIVTITTSWTAFMALLTSTALLLAPSFQPFVELMMMLPMSLDLVNVGFMTMLTTLAALVVALAATGTAITTLFAVDMIVGVTTFITFAASQFKYIEEYWFDVIKHMVGHWLDFVAAANKLTTEFVNTTIQEFDTLHNVTVGKIHLLRDDFKAAITDMATGASKDLIPVLQASGSAFGTLKTAAANAADAIVKEFDRICQAAKEAQACVTGSPELMLQHPFERFVEFMRHSAPIMARQFDQSILGPAEALEGASANFATSLNKMFEQVDGTLMNRTLALAGGGSSVVNNNSYSIGPNYQQPQSPGSVVDDLAVLDILSNA